MAGVSCLACGESRSEHWTWARDLEYLTSDEAFEYRRCRACGALSIDPVPRGRLAEIYPRNYYSFEGAGSPKAHVANRVKDWLEGRLLRRLLGSLPGESLSVLDVGGATGWELDRARSLEPRVRLTQVVDMDAAAERLARGRGHEYFRGLAQDYRTDRRFDLILMLNLIEHVDRPQELLSSMLRLLTSAGIILVKTPNHDSLDERLFRSRNWAGYHCPRHWVLFHRESFESLARRAGAQVAEFRYTQGAPFWAASLLAALASARWVSVTRERPVMHHPLYPWLGAAFGAADLLRGMFGAKTSQMFFVLRRG